MAEPGKARVADAPSVRIQITAQYTCVPKHGEVDNSGDVYFDVAQALSNGCLIHTSPAQAFEDEAADGYITLDAGSNGPYVPIVENATITYCACAVGGTCEPAGLQDDGGNTIKVGNPPEPGHRK